MSDQEARERIERLEGLIARAEAVNARREAQGEPELDFSAYARACHAGCRRVVAQLASLAHGAARQGRTEAEFKADLAQRAEDDQVMLEIGREIGRQFPRTTWRSVLFIRRQVECMDIARGVLKGLHLWPQAWTEKGAREGGPGGYYIL